MGFFTKGTEYNKMAKSLNGLYLMIDEIRQKKDSQDIRWDLYIATYLTKIEVLDRMELYKWKGSTPIYAPMIPGVKKNLDYALNQTIGKIFLLSNELGYEKEIEEIFAKGALYTEIENNIPQNIKNLII